MTVTTIAGLDLEALKQAILSELARQNVKFATLKTEENASQELIIWIETHRENQLDPRYVETVRVTSQIK